MFYNWLMQQLSSLCMLSLVVLGLSGVLFENYRFILKISTDIPCIPHVRSCKSRKRKIPCTDSGRFTSVYTALIKTHLNFEIFLKIKAKDLIRNVFVFPFFSLLNSGFDKLRLVFLSIFFLFLFFSFFANTHHQWTICFNAAAFPDKNRLSFLVRLEVNV